MLLLLLVEDFLKKIFGGVLVGAAAPAAGGFFKKNIFGGVLVGAAVPAAGGFF